MKSDAQIKKRIIAMAFAYRAGLEKELSLGSYITLMWVLGVEYLSVPQAEADLPRMVDLRHLNARLLIL